MYPPYTPSQCFPKYAFTALATTAPEYMGWHGPAEAEHHVAFSWRDICRRSPMGAKLNPTSIALVAALDYPSATKMDVTENRARTAVLPSVAYHGGGTVPATRLTPGSTAHQARFEWGGHVHLHAASRHRTHHSTFRRAPCPYDGGLGRLGGGLLRRYPVRKKSFDHSSWGVGVQLTAEVQWAPQLLQTAHVARTCRPGPLGPGRQQLT